MTIKAQQPGTDAASIPAADEPPIIRIEPARGWAPLNLRELWTYRELFVFLVWRDIKVRYKQTILGGAWAIIQPLFTMIVFSIFFGYLARIPSDGIPYPLFAYSALVPWTFFANALSQASNSLVEHERMITKVYFPRLIIPVASVLSGLLDFAIAFLVLIGMMLYYQVVPTIAILAVPLFVLLAAMTALAVGLLLAALNVQYRDVRYVIPFLVQFWLFATPIAYSSSIVPPAWRALYGLNPMAGVVEGFRWALLGQARNPGPLLAVSVATVIALLIASLFYFRRLEDSFADVV